MDYKKLIGDIRLWLAVVAVIIIGIFGYYMLSSGITIEASDKNADGIAPDSTFTIKMTKNTSLEEMYLKTSMEPNQGYLLTMVDEKTFVMKPYRAFEAKTNVKIKVAGKTANFKVRNTLVVTAFFPADGGEGVPVRSGIEITFNAKDISLEAFKAAVDISPSVNFEVTQTESKFILYPKDEEMKYETPYTVTIKNGLTTDSGAKLEKDFQIRFTTQSEFDEKNSYRFSISDNMVVNTLSSEKPVMRVYLDQEIANNPITVEVFSYKTADDFKQDVLKNHQESAYKYGSIKVDTDKLEKVTDFSGAAFSTANSDAIYNDGRRIVQFPELIDEGWYAVKMTTKYGTKEMVRYNFLQVSDLSVFYMRKDNDMLVWVNDAATGLPAVDATFQVEGSHFVSLKTDGDGKAQTSDLKLTADDNMSVPSIFTVKYGDRTFIDTRTLGIYMKTEYELNTDKYMGYVFTDRPIYKNTDTMKVWGAVRPRLPETPAVDKIILEIAQAEYKQEVKVNPDGTFTYEVPLKSVKVPYQWASVDIYLPYEVKDTEDKSYNKITVASTGIQIQDYVKPTYVAETKTDKPVYMITQGNKIKASIDVTTYDGTPVPDMKMNLEDWSDVLYYPTNTLITDETGNITVDMTLQTDDKSWYPRAYTYVFRNADSEGENFTKYGEINVLHHDIMIQGKTTVGTDSTSVDVTTNKIDISKIKTQDDLWDIENLRGSPLSVNVRAELHKCYYTKEENGTYYDYITRQSEKYYKYRHHDDIIKNFNFTTSEGKYKLTDLPKSDEDTYYYLVLTTTDSRGKDTRTIVYTGAEFYRGSRMGGVTTYNLNKRVDISKENANVMQGGDTTFPLAGELRYKFVDNETVSFYLEGNGEEIKDMKGSVIYTIVQNDFTQTGITTTGEITVPFSESLVPNYTITGAYFDGKHTFALEDKYMRFDPEKREIDIKLESDKEVYAPGDTIEITAKITNKSTGNALKDTNVVLSMVDEAIFALAEQNINILNDLYSSVYGGYIEKYTSYTNDDFGNAGEKGGGGGDEPTRSKFEDTAHFEVVKSNENGLAKFTFKLPDNITSWRMTSLALSPENFAGSTKSNVIVTKDYFLMPIMSEKLLEGDTLTVGLRGTGVGVTAADTSNYTVTVAGNGTTQKKEVSGKLREYTSVSFEGLKQGDYKVTIAGKCKNFSDTMELPVKITSTGVEVEMVKTINLKDGIKNINPLKYPVRMSVYDQSQVVYNTVFRDLGWYGQRADTRIARAFVNRELEKTGGTVYYGDEEPDTLLDLTDRIIKLYPYANGNPELTVKAILAVPEIIGTDGLNNINEYIGENYPDVSYSIEPTYINYVAQALRGDKLDKDLKQLIKANDTDYVGKIYLAMALHASGDTKSAEEAYDTLVKANLKELQGGSHKVYYIEKQGDKSAQDCTAAASMLATLLDKPEKDGLIMAVVKKPSAYEPYTMEKLFFANKYTASPSKSKFSYNKDGKVTTEALEERGKHLSFNEEAFKKADVKVIEGEVYADVSYVGAPSEQTNKEKQLVGIKKTITPVNGTEIKRGELVRVTIEVDLSKLDKDIEYGCFTLNEYIPSGMRFETYGMKNWGKGWYFENRESQRLQYSVHRATYNEPIVYYARCATEGDYIVESTYISSKYSDVWGMTPREKVKING